MRIFRLLPLIAAFAFYGSGSFAQAPPAVAPAATPAPAPPTPITPAPAVAPHVSVLSADQVIKILDETVDWYRTLGTQQENATQPSDLLILFANRQTADNVIGLAFDIARANAELLSSEASGAESAGDTSSPEAIGQQQNQIAAQRQSIQQEMTVDRQRSAASKKAAHDLEAKLPELQGELAMADARKNLLDTMAEFVNESNAKGAGANALKAHIDAIAATIPGTAANVSAATPAAAASAGNGAKTPAPIFNEVRSATPGQSGLWDLASNVMKVRNKLATIDVIDRHTAALALTFQQISAPPLEQLKTYSAQSDKLADQADNVSGATLQSLRKQFDTLAWLFKQTSAILIPLKKEDVLLRQYRHNLANWRDVTRRQYQDAWTALATRLAILGAILFVVFVLGEAWRRAVLRFAHEPRRRYQLLLVRKIVLWVVVIGIFGLSVVTELSTFATFAGLLTAGVAVAMQSVLVSVVGYFFLIGKYGIRVGDRIQIGTVVGEVIDLGLVRMHLMELNTQGPLGPTGRVVAFANLVVFQTSGGLFKQIPGVNFEWHETTITLPEVADYAALKEKLLAAITQVSSEYREEIVRQTKEIERSTETNLISDSTPKVQMRLANGRMEALIRYPVHMKHAVEIDERVSEAVLKVIADQAVAAKNP